MIYGRRDIPGDGDDIGDVVDQRSVLNRTIRAQVRSVDADNGVVTLIYENMPGGGKYVTAAPLWMSFPDSKTGNPSWGRFMPQEGDLVRVSFDYDDRPTIVGYDISAQKAGVADDLSGWPALNDQYKNAAGNSQTPPERAKFAQFIPISPGEYDFMSSGGAYIYGNNRGRLYLAGGSVSVSLIKNDLRLASASQLWSHIAEDCDFRFGQVRRINLSSQTEEKVAADSGGSFKEFSVYIKRSSPQSDIATFSIGNVVDNLGNIITSQTMSLPARLYYQAFNDSGAAALSMSIDSGGNWDVIAKSGTCSIDFSTVTISANTIKLGSGSASESVIRGDTYIRAESDWVNAVNASISSIQSAIAAAGTAFGATGSVPVVGSALGSALLTMAGAISSLATATAQWQLAKQTSTNNNIKVD